MAAQAHNSALILKGARPWPDNILFMLLGPSQKNGLRDCVSTGYRVTFFGARPGGTSGSASRSVLGGSGTLHAWSW